MSRHRDRGVVLVSALVAVAIVGALATTLARTATRGVDAGRAAITAAQADALVRSAVTTAAVLLGELAAREAPDTLDAPWTREAARPLGGGVVGVRIEDGARRIDLVRPEHRDALRRLIAGLALDPAVLDAIDDWTDRDAQERPRGAERGWYARRTPALVPSDGPLASLGELVLVRGLAPPTVARLAPFVTTEGEAGLNPNTAPPEVLVAVWGEARGRDVAAARRHDVVTCDALDTCVVRSQRYRVRAEADVDGVVRAVDAVVWSPPGVAPRVTGWRPVVPERR